ncbi:FHA domain-containing protein [Microbacterium faecale]|uniref:FHA domain-containing protein n=1 Tax=Microbacterium faecale TaxID=1804630 RepID=A0A917DC15_9MICO|nr:FHA domain-containing protein [Microbacterium faecale]GGD27446.1 FHA domain-containing protein [Microbacterium faecale]
MSELTLFVLQYGFLLLLWIFVFVLIFALRADVFGGRVRRLPESSAPSPPAAAPAAPVDNHAETVAHDMPRGSASSGSDIGRVVITSGPRAGLEIPLGTDPLTIGRSSESGLVIRDDYTSSHHARLIRYDGRWMLQDLDSTNGTFHDGERVTSGSPVAIRPGAPIKVGATTFELRK